VTGVKKIYEGVENIFKFMQDPIKGVDFNHKVNDI